MSGEGAPFQTALLKLEELGSPRPAGIPPALHFNTAVICRHRYLMKLTAVQEEKEAGSGSMGQACPWQALSSGIPRSVEHASSPQPHQPPSAGKAHPGSTQQRPLVTKNVHCCELGGRRGCIAQNESPQADRQTLTPFKEKTAFRRSVSHLYLCLFLCLLHQQAAPFPV